MKKLVSIIFTLAFLFLTLGSAALQADYIELIYKSTDDGYFCGLDTGEGGPWMTINNVFGTFTFTLPPEDAYFNFVESTAIGTPVKFDLSIQTNHLPDPDIEFTTVMAENVVVIGPPNPEACPKGYVSNLIDN